MVTELKVWSDVAKHRKLVKCPISFSWPSTDAPYVSRKLSSLWEGGCPRALLTDLKFPVPWWACLQAWPLGLLTTVNCTNLMVHTPVPTSASLKHRLWRIALLSHPAALKAWFHSGIVLTVVSLHSSSSLSSPGGWSSACLHCYFASFTSLGDSINPYHIILTLWHQIKKQTHAFDSYLRPESMQSCQWLWCVAMMHARQSAW
jgi:hypothetical protein